MQKEGYIYTGLGREKPCKKFGGKRQKIFMEPCRVGEREKSLEKFWKSLFEQVKYDFFKTWFMSFDWSKQTEAHKKF